MNLFQAHHFHRWKKSAFTLIEMVISAALMALILVSAYLCLNAGFASQKIIEPRTEIIQNARVAMALMTADLRNACSLPGDNQFLGMSRLLGSMQADNLDFATHNYIPRRPREGDFCEESIYVDRYPQTGQFSLWRRRNPLLAHDPLAGGGKEEIATGVVGLRFEYFDGDDWYDSWGELKSGQRENAKVEQSNLEGLPTAIRITLLLDSNPKSRKMKAGGERDLEAPLAFQTVVQLNLAASVQNNSDNAATNVDNGTLPTSGGSL